MFGHHPRRPLPIGSDAAKKAATPEGGGGSSSSARVRPRGLVLYSIEISISSTGMTTSMVTGTSTIGSLGSLLNTHSSAS